MVRATRITDWARDMARGMLRFGVHRSFVITHSHYKNINLATMSQGFTLGYSDAELEDIEKEVAPQTQDVSTKIEDDVISPKN